MKQLEYINPIFNYILSNNYINWNNNSDDLKILSYNQNISWKLVCKYKKHFKSTHDLSYNQNINIDIIKENPKRWDIKSIVYNSIYITLDNIINNENIFHKIIIDYTQLIFTNYIKNNTDLNDIKNTWVYKYIYDTYIEPNIYYNKPIKPIRYLDYYNSKVNIYNFLNSNYKYLFNETLISPSIKQEIIITDEIINSSTIIQLIKLLSNHYLNFTKIIKILDILLNKYFNNILTLNYEDLIKEHKQWCNHYIYKINSIYKLLNKLKLLDDDKHEINNLIIDKIILINTLSNPNISLDQAIELSNKYNFINWNLSYYSLNPNLTLNLILNNQNIKWDYKMMCYNNLCYDIYYLSNDYKKILVNNFLNICGKELINKKLI
jgi:hypothetical protein